MSEDLVIRHCAPTLAGIKTGNLFSCACPCKAALTKELCRLNRKLVPKGIRALPLRVQKGRALIYVYRPMRWSVIWQITVPGDCSCNMVIRRKIPTGV